MAEEIVVVVEPPPPAVDVIVEPPLPEVQVVISEVGLVGPPGELKPDQVDVLASNAAVLVSTELEPPVDLTLLFENALA